ncbi:DUF2336 domain-containing protein [Chelativorans sp. YIM 93263]|uniref:DUF2336 domain-containing protein n=1 Tax=Chelativorans sp. YIM 93263 TaxID=2906648 RepID=UPI0023781971|nr:DUF2336 domain-containing protein [Chelativorans sp. YIM 93263]
MSAIQDFLQWSETASVRERAAAASGLARAYIQEELAFDDRLAAEAALALLLDDPSPKVRLALSETLSLSDRAPMQVVAALADDQPQVAAPVIVRSPLLSDSDLVDRVATGAPEIQLLIASRPRVSAGLSASIAEVACAEACMALIRNDGAKIAPISFRRIIERHGDEARVRGALTGDPHLPADCRHALAASVATALSQAPLVRAAMGSTRAEKIARETCTRASITLIRKMEKGEYPALVEHLRLRGELTSGFLVRVLAYGHVDFFAAALAALTGQSSERVHTLISGGRRATPAVLLTKAGLAGCTHKPILMALETWRKVNAGREIAGPQEVSWRMLQTIDNDGADTSGEARLANLLKRIHLEMRRENARAHALALAAA